MEKLKTTFDDLPEYRARVQAARKGQTNEVIYNSSQRHAAVLIEQLFLSAQQTVRIVCRSLREGSYGTPDVLREARAFLDRGGEIHVIVAQPESGETNSFLVAMQGRQNVNVLVAPHVLEVVRFDFMVADGRAYRFEADATKCVARANFNDTEMAASLDESFENIVRAEPHFRTAA